MKTRTLTKILLVLVLVGCMFVLSGCPFDPIREGKVKPVQAYRNTFTIIPGHSKEHILALDVRVPRKRSNSLDLTPDETVWAIEAVKPVLAKGFIVTIGKVPSGFKQLIPSSGSSFIPIAGTRYTLSIFTDDEWADYETSWIVERSLIED